MDYLAFDLGASSGKMFRGAFDGERLLLTPAHAFINRIIPLANGLYWDFPGIYAEMCEGIKKAMGEKPFASFGIDSFNNDFSFIAQNGDLLLPVRSYRDPRAIRHQEAIYQKTPARELYMLTGNQVAPFNTFMQLAAMREDHQDDLFHQAHRLLFLPDLLAYYITGREYTEYTVAAETQMLDWDTRRWIPELLDILGMPESRFAPLVMPGSVIGNVSASFLRHNGVLPFSHTAVCAHDTASAFLAAPASSDTAILSCGTWSILGAENDRPVITEYGFRHNIANEGSLPGHHRVLRNVMGLWIVQQLAADYALRGKHFEAERIGKMALDAVPFSGFINPDDPVFYSPGEMIKKVLENRQGEKTHSLPDDPGALFRCVYESLAFQYRFALERIETLLKRKFRAVSIIGGGARDAALCQFTANALNVPVTAGPFDASALGNILVQMLAQKEIGSVKQGRDIIRRSFDLKEYLPRDTSAWDGQYPFFLRLAHPDDMDSSF